MGVDMAEVKKCRTCCFWGLNPVLVFSNETGEPFVIADCSHCSGMSGQEASCDYWRPRSGQPLGTGILPIWFYDGSWFEPASIIHDLRYDDQAGMSWAEIDQEWLTNALLLAGNDWQRQAVAYIGFMVIRAWSLMK